MSVKIEKRVVAVAAEIESDVAVLDGTDAEALIAAFNAAKAAIKEMEQAKQDAEKALRDLMGKATVGTIGGVDRLRISTIVRTGIDRDALKESFREAYEATRTETTYTVLKSV